MYAWGEWSSPSQLEEVHTPSHYKCDTEGDCCICQVSTRVPLHMTEHLCTWHHASMCDRTHNTSIHDRKPLYMTQYLCMWQTANVHANMQTNATVLESLSLMGNQCQKCHTMDADDVIVLTAWMTASIPRNVPLPMDEWSRLNKGCKFTLLCSSKQLIWAEDAQAFLESSLHIRYVLFTLAMRVWNDTNSGSWRNESRMQYCQEECKGTLVHWTLHLMSNLQVGGCVNEGWWGDKWEILMHYYYTSAASEMTTLQM